MNNYTQDIDEAGGFIDRKILSKLGSKRSKKTAETRVIDKRRAEQLWDAYLEVTGGGKEFDIRELATWLEKEVTIDGVKITKDIIASALKEAPFKVSVGEPKGTPEKQEKPAPQPQPKQSQPQTQPTTQPKKAADPKHPATGGFLSLDLPAITSEDGDWQKWADGLAKTQPQIFTKIAKAMGAKIQARKRA